MKPRVIDVRSENNHFQHLDVLKRNRTKRQRYGEFFVEGVTPLNRAIEYGWEMRALVYSTGARLSKWAREVIERYWGERYLPARAPVYKTRVK